MIVCFLAEGFEEAEALVTVDVLRRAGIEIVTAAVGAKNGTEVTGSHGITVKADINAESLKPSVDTEGIILPGGIPGTPNLEGDETVGEFISYSHENGKLIAAICAAPSILGKRGLLKGKRVTAYPGYESELKGADYTALPAVRDGNVITGKGAGAVFEFASEIVKYFKGDAVCEKLRGGMQCAR